jgi:hypothetical protein
MMSGLHRYSVYGVTIRSEWPLAFPPAFERAKSLAEVDFVDGTDEDFPGVDALREPDGPWFVPHVFADQSTYVHWSGLYEFRIPADGSRAVCRALNGADRSVLQNYLFGQALSFALVQQGLEPLHAAAAQVDDSAIGLLGDCTFGKSTLLASFVQAGARLLTDDLLMLTLNDRECMALPGTGRIKLHPDAAQRFLAPSTPSEPLNPHAVKRSFLLGTELVQESPLPLRHLFLLPPPEERQHTTSIQIEPLSRTELFQQLLRSSFNVEILTRDRLERQFACAAQLAMRLTGHRLHAPDGLEHLPAVRARIVDYVRRLDSAVARNNRRP